MASSSGLVPTSARAKAAPSPSRSPLRSPLLGLSLTDELLERGTPKRQAVLVPIGASLAIVVGAVGGAALLGHASSAVLSAVLAFGCAALLYLVTEELLTEAHIPSSRWWNGPGRRRRLPRR